MVTKAKDIYFCYSNLFEVGRGSSESATINYMYSVALTSYHQARLKYQNVNYYRKRTLLSETAHYSKGRLPSVLLSNKYYTAYRPMLP